MAYELPALPYAQDALAPHMSAETLEYHHGKHHQKYVDTLNDLTNGEVSDDAALEKTIVEASGKLFNQAAQVCNHNFFWKSLKPGGGGAPAGDLADAIGSAFGSFDSFKEQFHAEAAGHFGSGWAWLVHDGSGLSIVSTHDADTPLAHSQKPLFTVDVWEHAYYIDYRNARPGYLTAVLDNLANWDFAAENLAAV